MCYLCDMQTDCSFSRVIQHIAANQQIYNIKLCYLVIFQHLLAIIETTALSTVFCFVQRAERNIGASIHCFKADENEV